MRDLDCVGLVDCLGECPIGDDPCDEACIARSTPTGLARATELASCAEASACADEACLTTNCEAELLACADVATEEDAGEPLIHEDAGPADAPSDALPVRIEGTTRDRSDLGGVVYDSVGHVVFVRDDAAGDAEGFPIGIVAFYRVESLTYDITVSGTTAGGCVHSASESFVATVNDPFENNLMIERAPAGDGLHPYGFSLAGDEPRPGAISVSCPGFGTTHSDLTTGHHVAHGIDEPHSDLRTFVGEFPQGPRVMSWDLRAVP